MVNRKFNSIFQVARDWKMNRINIMQLIIAGELKVSLFQKDVGITNCDKFSDIPQDLRENLNVIRPKGMTKDEYNKLLQPWLKIVITDEEMERYVANNPPKESISTQRKVNDNIDNPKSHKSLLILVATMASKKYKYDPRESKSDVPAIISRSADELGLPINEKTVREWLRKAVDLIDGDKY